jgi:reactive chlorine resistance protein C
VIGTLPQSRVSSSRFALRARPFELASGAILRFSLVLFLILFGLAKFTEGEALTIQPWVANSPFLGWLYAVTSVQGGSNLIGIIELILGVLLAVRPWWPRASVIGSLGATIAFAITLSFLFTTPDLSPAWSGFLMKDLVLVGAALWTAADSLRAIERRAQ